MGEMQGEASVEVSALGVSIEGLYVGYRYLCRVFA